MVNLVSDQIAIVLDSMAAGQPLDYDKINWVTQLLALARQTVDQLVSEQLYDEAQDYEDALRTLLVISDERSVESKRFYKRSQITSNLARTEADLAEAEAQQQQQLEAFDAETRLAHEKMQTGHEEALAAFDDETQQGMPETFRKLSQKLLVLREQEKALLQTKRYEEAAEIKEIADRQEREEDSALREKFAEMRAIQRGQMCDVHHHELGIFNEKSARKRLGIEQDVRGDVEAKKKATDNLQKRLRTIDGIMEEAANRAKTMRVGSVITKSKRASSSQGSDVSTQLVTVATQTTARCRFTRPLKG